jgi:hypothetical protein
MTHRRGWFLAALMLAALLLAACQPRPTNQTAEPVEAQPTPSPEVQASVTPTPLYTLAGVGVDVYPQADSQDDYLFVYLNLYNDFFSAFGIAQNEGAEWVKNPLEVALRFEEWPPAVPGCTNRKVYTLPTEDRDQAIFIMLLSGCPDDSISEMKLRVELQRVETYWNIRWAGKMWKCSRSEFPEYNENWNLFPCP